MNRQKKQSNKVMYQRFDSQKIKSIFLLKNKNLNVIQLILLCVCSVSVSFVIGLLIGHAWSMGENKGRRPDEAGRVLDYYEQLIHDDANNRTVRERLFNEINVGNIKHHLKYFTSLAHSAGTEGDRITSEYIYNQWKKQGLDSVQMIDYDVLLDMPDESILNNIQLFDQDKKLENLYEIIEEVYNDESLNNTQVNKPFLAYSKNGSFNSDELYYVNYCNIDDFEYVINRTGVNFTNKIVLCRYGYLFRGNKIKNAENYGVKGVILFDDPIRCSPPQAANRTYPNGLFMPESGTQRGTIWTRDGDPLTPLYPSKSYTYRMDEKDQDGLPKIVAQVIGYKLAQQLIDILDSNLTVPDSWKGTLNTTYVFGGKLKQNRSLTINVYNERKIKKIYNVMGVIKGSFEPDRYVMIGNHKDSWTLGSVDPNSGTSVLLEVSRSLAELKNAGLWSPRRSIVFFAWSAEEYGLIGSTELIEEFKAKLFSNGVIYLNCDLAVMGNYSYQAKASPLVHDLLFEVTKSIRIDQNETVYDRWLRNDPNEFKTEPFVNSNLGANSDHTMFAQRVGIVSIDNRFAPNRDDDLLKNIRGSYPLYHTSYETYRLIEQFLDQDFKASELLSKVMAEIVRSMSSSLIVPFNCSRYANVLNREFAKFQARFGDIFQEIDVKLDDLNSTLTNFTRVAEKFHQRLHSLNKREYHTVRVYNEQLKNLERAFLDGADVHETGYMHTLFAPSTYNKYIGNTFPNLVNALINYQFANTQDAARLSTLINAIKFNLSVVVNSIQSAISVLKEPIEF